MDSLIFKLKSEIDQKLGFKLKRQSDVKYLHQQITINVLRPIGFNTLRRFFGFLPSGAPQLKTLDTLCEFLGYKSFSNFSIFVDKDANWDRWTFISDFENADSLTPEMINRLEILKPHNDYVYHISSLIKSFIRRERLDLLKILFLKRSPGLLFKENNINSEEVIEVLKIAYAVGAVLRTLSRPQYENLAPLLHDDYVFKTDILDFYIDYSNFNGYYGFFIKNRILADQKPENKLFSNLIWQYNLFLSGKSTYKPYKPNISKLKLYPALLGRLLGYEIITTHFKESKPINNLVTNISKVAKTQHVSVFFIEVFPALIFIKAIDEIEYLFSEFSKELFESNNWRYYATQNTYLISLALVKIKNKDYDLASYNLNLVTLDRSKTNSYYAYLKLFYLITSYHLELQTTAHPRELISIEAEYSELVKVTGFKRFNLSFLKKYF